MINNIINRVKGDLNNLRASLRGLLSIKYLIDIIIMVGSYRLSYLLRFEGVLPDKELAIFEGSLLAFVFGFLVCELLFGLTKSIWRYTSLQDIEKVGLFVLAGNGLSIIVGLIFFPQEMKNIPRSIYIINSVFLFLGMSGARLSYRIIFDQLIRVRRGGSNVLIVGDQNIGASIQSSILKDRGNRFKISGFITLEEKRIGNTINATPIIGTLKDIPSIVKDKDIEYIFIALDSASNEEMKKVIKISESTGVLTRITPGVVDLVNGKLSLNDLREIKFEDYLDRQPVKLDTTKLKSEFYQKSILVTGAGGSIGSSLCEELLKFSPAKLIALDLSENNLFNASRKLTEISDKINATSTEIIYRILDIKNKVMLERLLEANQVDYIIHAAALKHLPFSEENILAAIETNVCGTLNLLFSASKFKIKKFIYISTDKAVEPTSIMGATKRLGELLIKSFNQGKANETKFMAVRFGNVIGSSGNVVEIVTQQVQKNLRVTITDPQMERYFMSLEEAGKLIMGAVTIGEDGEIFVLDMGRPVKIIDLAKDIALFYGRQLKDEDIVYIGKRKAEKFSEKLFSHTENKVKTSLAKIFKVEEKIEITDLFNKTVKLCENINRYSEDQLKKELFLIINEQSKS